MTADRLRAIVLGDLVTDLVLLPAGPLRPGTDVAGRVVVRQGGSAATTARVLAAAGVATTFVTAIGPDAAGEALVATLAACGVEVRAVPIAGSATGRLGVLVDPSGERTFVADRGAILRLRPRHIRAGWFRGASLLHLPAYSLVPAALGEAGERAAALARAAGAAISIDLASAGFLEEFGVESVLDRVRRIGPDVILANQAERSLVAAAGDHALLDLAPLVVLKQGSHGAAALRRGAAPIAVPCRRIAVHDSTGAGDAFDAGFLAAWLASGKVSTRAALVPALRAGHAAARREVTGPRLELEPPVLVGRVT